MRKLLHGMIAVLIIFAVVTTAYGSNVPEILFKNLGLKAELPAIEIDRQILDPLREIAEVLGINVSPENRMVSPETSTEPNSPALTKDQLIDMAKSTIVEITAVTGIERVGMQIHTNYLSGTGFNIDPSGLIVTNSHVVSSATEISVRFPDGFSSKAALILNDKKKDLAVLQLEEQNQTYPWLKLGDSNTIRTGQKIMVLGYPLGVGDLIAAEGTISGLADKVKGTEVPMIEVTADVQQGNSGSPLLDYSGDVIGIITASLISETSFSSEQFGGAIPVNTLKEILP